MAHAVHTTKAIVLGSADVQDADKLFWLLTEDFGLLFASAKSIREETSKLRYALQDLALPRVSLVRGRGIWRITGAEENKTEHLPMEAAEIFGRLSKLARRLMPSDEKNPELFSVLQNARKALVKDSNDLETIESVTVARMLYHLGYLSCTPEYRGIIDTQHFDEEIFVEGKKMARKLIHDINSGLEESQL